MNGTLITRTTLLSAAIVAVWSVSPVRADTPHAEPRHQTNAATPVVPAEPLAGEIRPVQIVHRTVGVKHDGVSQMVNTAIALYDLPPEFDPSEGIESAFGAFTDMFASPSVDAVNVATDCSWDSSIAVYACLEQHYNVYSQSGYDDAISLVKYRWRWNWSLSGYSVMNARLAAAVNGTCVLSCEGVGFWNKKITRTTGSVTNGTWYYVIPEWANDYVRVSSNGAYQCANMEADVKRNYDTWHFYGPQLCQGSVGGWL